MAQQELSSLALERPATLLLSGACLVLQLGASCLGAGVAGADSSACWVSYLLSPEVATFAFVGKTVRCPWYIVKPVDLYLDLVRVCGFLAGAS